MYWKILAKITTHGEFAPRSISTSSKALDALIILLMLLKIKSYEGWVDKLCQHLSQRACPILYDNIFCKWS